MTETVPRPQTPEDRQEEALIQEEALGRSATLLPTGHENDALIKEARRLRRRRWYFGSVVTALVIGAAGAGYLSASEPPARSDRAARRHSPEARGSVSERASVPTRSPDLIQPTTL